MSPGPGYGGKGEQASFGWVLVRFILACKEEEAGSFIKGGGIVPALLLHRKWGGVFGTQKASAAGLQRSLAQSRHSISSLSGIKPLPTSEVAQRVQVKQLWCQWRSSKETYLPPPKPVMGLVQALHFFA